jgi:hypothetical protein
MQEMEETLRYSHDWVMNRINELCANSEYKNAKALKKEFNEWLNPSIEEHNIVSLKFIGEEDDIRSS